MQVPSSGGERGGPGDDGGRGTGRWPRPRSSQAARLDPSRGDVRVPGARRPRRPRRAELVLPVAGDRLRGRHDRGVRSELHVPPRRLDPEALHPHAAPRPQHELGGDRRRVHAVPGVLLLGFGPGGPARGVLGAHRDRRRLSGAVDQRTAEDGGGLLPHPRVARDRAAALRGPVGSPPRNWCSYSRRRRSSPSARGSMPGSVRTHGPRCSGSTRCSTCWRW